MDKARSIPITNHRLMQRYRTFRQGILVLPLWESHLVQELERLTTVHVAVSKVPVEYEYIINSLKTIRKQIRTTHEALSSVKRAVDKSGDSASLQEKIDDLLKDSPNSKDILLRLRVGGGPSEL